MARWLRLRNEQEQEAADGVADQNVSPPQPERVREADQEEGRHPPGVERDAPMTRGRPIHLDGEADPEERGEKGDELALDQPVNQRLREPVGQPRPHQGRLDIRGDRRVEPAHVGGEDAEERGAAEAVDDSDALVAGHRADGFGFGRGDVGGDGEWIQRR